MRRDNSRSFQYWREMRDEPTTTDAILGILITLNIKSVGPQKNKSQLFFHGDVREETLSAPSSLHSLTDFKNDHVFMTFS